MSEENQNENENPEVDSNLDPNGGAENEVLEGEEVSEAPVHDAEEDKLVGVTGLRDMQEEMETCYLDYAMSVIVSRALPDVRDGLKPVHRRILYSMSELGLRSSAKFRKSATVVGDVLGKYHPHGDSSVYGAMVRLAQDFSMRYQLVDGQGNFGSVDGDSAAAMRYTEAKMQKITDEMLGDLDKDTVDFMPNYDETRKEPKVLPTRVPQLLANGVQGIAVGMATNIPPHNLGELLDALIYLVDNSEATVEDLLSFIKGPDFPTGGVLYDGGGLKEAYSTGRGKAMLRSVAEIQEMKNGKSMIVVTEIPYQVNKSNLIIKMANLVRDKKVVGITDIRDESSSQGIRVVIELAKTAYPNKILNQLYKYTQLQESINFNMIALVDGIQPRLLNLKTILEEFVKHREVVITRRTQYELRIAEARAHILEGLKIALDQIDAVINTIRSSKNKEEAKENLIAKFKLSVLQAQAILDMRLQALSGLERQKVEDEYKEKMDFIGECKAILADRNKVLTIAKDELIAIKEKYADERKTKIIGHALGSFSAKDTIPNAPMVVMLTKENYVKRISPASFRTQHRGGKGVIGATTKDADEIAMTKFANNHDELMLFTNNGRVFKLPTYEIPQTSRQAKGTPIVNLLQLQPEEKITAILNMGEGFEGQYLFMCTKGGTVKKTLVKDFENVRKSGLIAIKLKEDDSLEWVRETSPAQQVMIVTQNGKSVRFDENGVRPMGRASQGVRGIRLTDDDKVVEMDVLSDPDKAELLVIMENGLGKKTKVSAYRLQARGGTGVKTASITSKTGKIIGAKIMEGFDGDIVLVAKSGQTMRTKASSIPARGRATQGVFVMRVPAKDKIASMAFVASEPEIAELETDVKTADVKDKKTQPVVETGMDDLLSAAASDQKAQAKGE